jgi:hypothetical protein
MSKVLSVDGFDMFVGEVRQQGFALARTDGMAISADSATYQRVFEGVLVDAVPIAATIDGNQVYADIPAGGSPGHWAAMFTAIIDTQTVITKVGYTVLDW